jgi:MraZ protein
LLLGEYVHIIDDKGRLLLPQPLREELGELVYLVRGRAGQINVYPRANYEDMASRASLSDSYASRISSARRFFMAATPVDVDKQGRIVVPSHLRIAAGLDGEIVVSGNSDHAELWNAQRWNAAWNAWVSDGGKVPEETNRLDELGWSL